MKTVLCFGDSNTWGCISDWDKTSRLSARFGEDTRWAAVLRTALGADYRVIEDGLNGRTTIYCPEDEPYKDGEPYLRPCLMAHHPLDAVILMLGTNDLRLSFGVTLDTLGDGVRRLIDIVRQTPKAGVGGRAPKILLVAPVPVVRPEGRMDFYIARGEERAETLSAAFAPVYQRVALETGCAFLNAGEVASASKADGLHLDAGSHIRLGLRCAEIIRRMLGDDQDKA